MFKPSIKSKEKKAMKQKIIGISTIVIIAIIVGIVFAVNNGGSIEKYFNKKEQVQALTSTAEVNALWVNSFGNATNANEIDMDIPYATTKIQDGGIIVGGRLRGNFSTDLGNNVNVYKDPDVYR